MAMICNRTCQKNVLRVLEVKSNKFATATQLPEAPTCHQPNPCPSSSVTPPDLIWTGFARSKPAVSPATPFRGPVFYASCVRHPPAFWLPMPAIVAHQISLAMACCCCAPIRQRRAFIRWPFPTTGAARVWGPSFWLVLKTWRLMRAVCASALKYVLKTARPAIYITGTAMNRLPICPAITKTARTVFACNMIFMTFQPNARLRLRLVRP